MTTSVPLRDLPLPDLFTALHCTDQGLTCTGSVVGLLGDGISDGAALRQANVGISVDTAVDVAREAATLVLLNKNLHVIADGVLAGRQTLANTVKYVRVTMSANFGNMLSLVIATAFLPFLPLLQFRYCC